MSGEHMAPLFGQEPFVMEEFRNRRTEAFLDALDDLIIEDILAMSGDELRAEIVAEGGDPDAIEAECRASLERAIRTARSGLPLAGAGPFREGLRHEFGDLLPDGGRPLLGDRHDAGRRGPGGLHEQAAVVGEDDLRDEAGAVHARAPGGVAATVGNALNGGGVGRVVHGIERGQSLGVGALDVAGRPARGGFQFSEDADGGGVVLGLVGHAREFEAVPVRGQPRTDAEAPAGGLPATWSAW